MSLLVFVGVFTIGNPIDSLINPDADQLEHARTIAAFGLYKPLWEQYFLFIKNALGGDTGQRVAITVALMNKPDLIISPHWMCQSRRRY